MSSTSSRRQRKKQPERLRRKFATKAWSLYCFFAGHTAGRLVAYVGGEKVPRCKRCGVKMKKRKRIRRRL